MSPFELDVLGSVADDYEAVHTVRGDLERDLGRPISVQEPSSALVHLVELGFVDAFVFDSGIRNYRRVDLSAGPVSALWFYISSGGRAEYERRVA